MANIVANVREFLKNTRDSFHYQLKQPQRVLPVLLGSAVGAALKWGSMPLLGIPLLPTANIAAAMAATLVASYLTVRTTLSIINLYKNVDENSRGVLANQQLLNKLVEATTKSWGKSIEEVLNPLQPEEPLDLSAVEPPLESAPEEGLTAGAEISEGRDADNPIKVVNTMPLVITGGDPTALEESKPSSEALIAKIGRKVMNWWNTPYKSAIEALGGVPGAAPPEDTEYEKEIKRKLQEVNNELGPHVEVKGMAANEELTSAPTMTPLATAAAKSVGATTKASPASQGSEKESEKAATITLTEKIIPAEKTTSSEKRKAGKK